MTLNSRLERLEQKSRTSALVACPYLLDREGKRFSRSPQDPEITAVRFVCDGNEFVVNRASGEGIKEMEERASHAAKEAFNCVVVLPFYMEWI